ncbi:abl interactor 2 [Octopus bimaculoides]|uniref:SH3 domain-containing protein n=1 Tax=Octopus bimaculoides TaxID=37653 RepID=A0A0L8GFK6_OCTBM|nr:abl interactor 2 [Octopus bimaculoides]XP_052829855.1 abl interactor 2 [Octopus bimaculoides]|eukprot:XP_014781775.1 PREDICTED: abl interactor 2-like [Octopus bimaculoides]
MATMEGHFSMEELYANELPSAVEELGKNYENLRQVADYCDIHYKEIESSGEALVKTRNYVNHSLACVAGQIGTAADKFLQLLDEENKRIDEAAAIISELTSLTAFHEQKISRRCIAQLLCKKGQSHVVPSGKGIIVYPSKLQKSAQYKRAPIDYSALDDIGNGVKIETQYGPTISIHTYARGLNRNSSLKGRSSKSQPSGYATISHSGVYSQYRVTGQPLLNSSSSQPSIYKSIAPPVAPVSPVRRSKLIYATQRSASVDINRDIFTDSLLRKNRSHSVAPDYDRQVNRMSNLSLEANWQPSVRHTAPTENPPPPPSLAALWTQAPIATEEDNDFDDTLPPPPLPSLQPSQLQNPQAEDLAYPPPSPLYPSVSDLPETTSQSYENQGLYQTTGMYMMKTQEPENYIEKVIAVYDYTANEPDELTFNENAVIYVLQKNENGWWDGILNGEQGVFPCNYVEPCV